MQTERNSGKRPGETGIIHPPPDAASLVRMFGTGEVQPVEIAREGVDSLNDVIEPYKLDMKVVQVLELVENALVY